jgi:hypothetical protein
MLDPVTLNRGQHLQTLQSSLGAYLTRTCGSISIHRYTERRRLHTNIYPTFRGQITLRVYRFLQTNLPWYSFSISQSMIICSKHTYTRSPQIHTSNAVLLYLTISLSKIDQIRTARRTSIASLDQHLRKCQATYVRTPNSLYTHLIPSLSTRQTC